MLSDPRARIRQTSRALPGAHHTWSVSGGVIATWTFSENNEEGWGKEHRLLFGVIRRLRETEPIDRFLEIYKQERECEKEREIERERF